MLSSTSNFVSKYPITTAAITAATGAGLAYLMSDTEEIKNAKNFINTISNVREKLEKTQDLLGKKNDNIRRLNKEKDSLEEEIEIKRVKLESEMETLKNDIEDVKLQLSNELLKLDPRAHLYKYKKEKSLADFSLKADTIINNERRNIEIDSEDKKKMEVYKKFNTTENSLENIKDLLNSIYKSDNQLAPRTYKPFIGNQGNRRALVTPPPKSFSPAGGEGLPTWKGPGQPAPPAGGEGLPTWKGPGQPAPAPDISTDRNIRLRYQTDLKAQALYDVYVNTWNTWNEFVKGRTDINLLNGLLPVGIWERMEYRTYRRENQGLEKSIEFAKAQGATTQEIIQAQNTADNRNIWSYA